MTSNPCKRVADDEWESPSFKARRGVRPVVPGPSKSRRETFRVGPQPPRQPLADIRQPRPLADIQQPRQYHTQPPLAPRYNKPSLPHTAPPLPPHSQHHVAPGHHRLPQREELSYPASTSTNPTPIPGVPYKPAVHHSPHPRSKLCQDFHWVPYPLGLLPFDSWFTLHHKPEHAQSHSFLCPACLAPRKPTPHTRKLFLVAERLSCEDGITSIHDKSLNEELSWAVNYELGILDPFVEDPQQIPGGKHSRLNSFYPYANEYEMKLAFKYIFVADEITEPTWALWIASQLTIQRMLNGEVQKTPPSKPSLREDGIKVLESRSSPQTLEVETIDLTGSDVSPSKGKVLHGLSTSPSSFQQASEGACKHLRPSAPNDMAARPLPNHQRRIVSYKTLQDFYGLLDKIERTSFVGAMFLEAYAERLRDDICKACWLKRNVDLDLY